MLYVILQDEIAPKRLSKYINSLKIRHWLYLGENSTWRLRAERCIFPEIPRISISQLLDEIALELRQSYIDWIGELSEINGTLEWWASELAAKNPYTNMYVRICYLEIMQRLLVGGGLKDSTLIVCTSVALAEELICIAGRRGISVERLAAKGRFDHIQYIKSQGRRYARRVYWRYAGLFVSSFFFRLQKKYPCGTFSRLSEHYSFRRRYLIDRDISVDNLEGEDSVLLFTWVDHRNFIEHGRFRDPHLGPLAEHLLALGFRVGYVFQVLPSIRFEEAVDCLLRLPYPAYFPEYFANDSGSRNCRRRANKYRPAIPTNSAVGSISVHKLALEHIEEYRENLARTLCYEPFVADLYAHGVRPAWIIHTCEGHSWEQALTWSIKKHMPDTKVVGFENGTFSRMVHSMYPASGEFSKRPLPDKVLTYGALSRDILTREGWPLGRIKEGCALRHDYLCHVRSQSAFIGNSSPVRLLVATGIGASETIELVEKAARAFANDDAYRLMIKCHPSVDVDWVMSELGEAVKLDNLIFESTPISELLAQSHMLLFTYTTVCYEALLYGVLPIFVQAENFLNLNKMDALSGIYWHATDANGLRQVVNKLKKLSSAEYEQWRSKALNVARYAFTPVSEATIKPFVS